MSDKEITDQGGNASFEAIVYRYDPPPPAEAGTLQCRDDGYPLFAPPRGEQSALWLRIEEKGNRAPTYYDLDPAAAVALADELYAAAKEFTSIEDQR